MPTKLSPIHPGEILHHEFMEPLGLSQRALARELAVPVTRISQILAGRRGITADTALRLARHFKVSPEFWMNLQQSYDLRQAKRETEAAIRREVKPTRLKAADDAA